jgi:hypothetical protein
MKYYDDASVRTELKARLGDETIVDKEWNYFVKCGDVSAVMRGEKDMNWLVDRVIAFCDATDRPIQRRVLPEMISVDQLKKRIEHQVLLSELAADEAARQSGVVDFRKEVLKERLLAPEQVESWINQQAKLDGPASHWLGDVPVPSNHQLEFDAKLGGLVIRPELKLSRLTRSTSLRFLDYAALPDLWVRRVPIAAGGVLERLKYLGEDLVRSYDWEAAAATLFVLTGRIPLIQPLILKFTLSAATFKRRAIELSVDPAVSPAELAKQYGVLRSKLISGRRVRPLSEKHLRLASFIVEKPDESWASRLHRWNKAFPKWKYVHSTNFRRDVLKARERIIGNVVREPAHIWKNLMAESRSR